MEAPLLEAIGELIGDNGDYLAVKGVKSWWRVFCIESAKLWRICGPIAVQILCQYGIGSVTAIFVGHLGDIQLSAFSIATSVVSMFSFGLLVSLYISPLSVSTSAYSSVILFMILTSHPKLIVFIS